MSDEAVLKRQKRAARKLERSKLRKSPEGRKEQKEKWKRQRKARAQQDKPADKRGTTKDAVAQSIAKKHPSSPQAKAIEKIKKPTGMSTKAKIGLGAAGLAATGYGVYRAAKAIKHRRELAKARKQLGEEIAALVDEGAVTKFAKRAASTVAFGSKEGEAPGFFGGAGHGAGLAAGTAVVGAAAHKIKKMLRKRKQRLKAEHAIIAKAKRKTTRAGKTK
jgi:hypothetical protein